MAGYFKPNDETDCLKARLSQPWLSQTKISCIAKCKSRFQTSCRSVLYNTQTLACTPVHPKTLDDARVNFSPGDTLFSQDQEQGLTCDTTAGFQLFTSCGEAVCVFPVDVKTTYANATAACQAMHARLYAPNTYERYRLLELISPKYTWVGLTMLSGDAWRWTTGEAVDPDFEDFMWSVGQPNNLDGLGELCAARTHSVHLDKLHDWPCVAHHRYVCEQNY